MFEQLKGKKLYRSPKDALVFGVCSGLGRYFQVDAVFVRVGAIVVSALTDFWYALAVYVVLVLLMPIDPAQDTVPSRQEPRDVTDEPGEDEDL